MQRYVIYKYIYIYNIYIYIYIYTYIQMYFFRNYQRNHQFKEKGKINDC